MSTPARTPRQLWQDYLFLTREMRKFLSQDSMKLFYELVDQRAKLQKLIEAVDSSPFKASTEGAALFRSVEQENAVITRELKRRQNSVKKQENLSAAYDVLRPKRVGARMDQKG